MSEITQFSIKEELTKILLWVLRRPISIWFVLLFGIWTFAIPVIFFVLNKQEVLMYFGASKFVEVLIAPFIALAASVLALFLRKESIAFFMIYYVLYFMNIFRVPPDTGSPEIRFGIAVQVTLGIIIFLYLIYLKKQGRLK